MKKATGGFGLAEIKVEGGKLWPYTYFELNGRAPLKSFYTAAELAEHKAAGITDFAYADALDYAILRQKGR